MAAGDYPKSLFNKGVRTQDEEYVGHVMMETQDKVVIFGERGYRFDVPKSAIIAVGRNVILGMDYAQVFGYRVDRNALLQPDRIFYWCIQEPRSCSILFFAGTACFHSVSKTWRCCSTSSFTSL